MEYNGSRRNPRQEIRQIKAKANVKMINNFYHTNDYQLSRDKKYFEMIPGGRFQRYPSSYSHQIQKKIATCRANMPPRNKIIYNINSR